MRRSVRSAFRSRRGRVGRIRWWSEVGYTCAKAIASTATTCMRSDGPAPTRTGDASVLRGDIRGILRQRRNTSIPCMSFEVALKWNTWRALVLVRAGATHSAHAPGRWSRPSGTHGPRHGINSVGVLCPKRRSHPGSQASGIWARSFGRRPHARARLPERLVALAVGRGVDGSRTPDGTLACEPVWRGRFAPDRVGSRLTGIELMIFGINTDYVQAPLLNRGSLGPLLWNRFPSHRSLGIPPRAPRAARDDCESGQRLFHSL